MKKTNVAILTNFMDFNPGYSLSGIVVDQALMLLRRNHKVFIYVNEQYNPKFNDAAGLSKIQEQYPDSFQVLKKTKFMHLDDYSTKKDLSEKHEKQAIQCGDTFEKEFIENGIDIVFTHDFIFTGWNLPYSEAIKHTTRNIEKQKTIKWYHWVHSCPSGARDWWNLSEYGVNHFVVFPNRTEIMRVAEAFKTNPKYVKVIPHIKDIRSWYDFSDLVWNITDQFPGLMDSKIVQVYPCSTDRLFAKQLHLVIKLFSYFKKNGTKSFLFIANQWATGRQRKESLEKYISLGEHYGLTYGIDFIFSSHLGQEYETGISRQTIRELQLLSNVFVFPTREESFGLVGPEASFSGCLPVINRSLTMQFEVMGQYAPAFDFGSFHQNTPQSEDDNYLNNVSLAIMNSLFSNEAIMTKIYTKMRYNMDSVYDRYYAPLIFSL